MDKGLIQVFFRNLPLIVQEKKHHIIFYIQLNIFSLTTSSIKLSIYSINIKWVLVFFFTPCRNFKMMTVQYVKKIFKAFLVLYWIWEQDWNFLKNWCLEESGNIKFLGILILKTLKLCLNKTKIDSWNGNFELTWKINPEISIFMRWIKILPTS